MNFRFAMAMKTTLAQVGKALRPRQEEAVDVLVNAMTDVAGERRALFVAPTGWGKTAVISKVIEKLYERRKVDGDMEGLPFKVLTSPF